MTQTDEIHSGGSYLSQNDLRVHFGLGSATKIEKVEIHWPSDTRRRLVNPGVDQHYSVIEGQWVLCLRSARVSSLPKHP